MPSDAGAAISSRTALNEAIGLAEDAPLLPLRNSAIATLAHFLAVETPPITPSIVEEANQALGLLFSVTEDEATLAIDKTRVRVEHQRLSSTITEYK